jgi:hypothetical protein
MSFEIINPAPSATLEVVINSSPVTIEVSLGGYAIPGPNGRSPEFRVSSGFLQYRLIGDADWINVYNITGGEIGTVGPYSGTRDALASDGASIIELDGTSVPTNYRIDPALFPNKRLFIRCVSNPNITNQVKITAITGTIETINGDQSEMELGYRDTIAVHSNGTNLRIE